MKTFLQFWTENVDESMAYYQDLLSKITNEPTAANHISKWFEILKTKETKGNTWQASRLTGELRHRIHTMILILWLDLYYSKHC
jgi:hypothetical protein